MRRVTIPLMVFGSLALAAPSGADIEYVASYVAVPGEIVWVERNLIGGAVEANNELVRFGAMGFRLGVGLPARLGPFTAGVEAGFGLPAGGYVFDHKRLTRNGEGFPDLNVTHEDDLTTWDLTIVPVLFKLRYSPPTDSIALGGQFGFGPVILARNTEYTETRYAGALMTSRETKEWQDVLLPMAVELTAGIVVPMAEALSLNVFGGLLWMSEVRDTTTDNLATPIQVYGEKAGGGAFSRGPALKLGGLGYSVRVAFTLAR